MRNEDDNSLLKALGAVGVGAGTYALTRRFRPSSIPQLRRLQEASEKGGVNMHLPEMAKVPGIQSVFEKIIGAAYGMPTGNKAAAAQFNLLQKPGDILAGKEVVNPIRIASEMADKGQFGKAMRDTGATPTTMGLREALRKAGDDPAELERIMGGEYLIKPTHGALEKVSDFATHGDVLTQNEKAQRAFSDASAHIIQKKMPSTAEYRVHMLDGKAYGISNRHIKSERLRNLWQGITGYEGGGAFVPVFNRNKRRAIADFTEKAMADSKFTKLPEGEHIHGAFDVLETPEGFKIVDANTRPGTLMNPLNNRQLKRLMTGRWGRDVSALAGAGAGTAAYGTMEAFDDR